MADKKSFYQLVADLVDVEIRNHEEKREEVASVIGVTESFVKKVHSPTEKQHYNLIHLFLLAKHWNIQVDSFMPSAASLCRLDRYRSANEEILKKEIAELIGVLRREYIYE